MNRKVVGISAVIVVCIIISVIIFIQSIKNSNGGNESNKLDCEHNFYKAEYDEKYNVVTETISAKNSARYKFNWNVTLSSGTCIINVLDKNRTVLWTKVIDNTSLFEEIIELSNIVEGECNITMKINEETEGNAKLIVVEI